MARRIDIETLCAEKGLRITEQRKIIARILDRAEDHPDVIELHRRAAAALAQVGYRTGGVVV